MTMTTPRKPDRAASTLLELAERCERASGPDRELDLAIHLALWPASDIAKMVDFPRGLEGRDGYSWEIRQSFVVFEKWVDGRCPYNGVYPLLLFTGSIDAAMTLVPRLSLWSVCDMEDGPFAQVIYLVVGGGYVNGLTTAKASTPALALCAAALRAKSEQHGGKTEEEALARASQSEGG